MEGQKVAAAGAPDPAPDPASAAPGAEKTAAAQATAGASASGAPPANAAAAAVVADAPQQNPARPAIPEPHILCVTEKGETLPVGKEEDQKFLASLRRFIYVRTQLELGVGMYRIPRMGKEEVNLPQLYRSVLLAGGYQKAITKKGSWKVVAYHMKVPSTVTNAAYMLRVHYEKFLLDYEYTFWDNPERDLDLAPTSLGVTKSAVLQKVLPANRQPMPLPTYQRSSASAGAPYAAARSNPSRMIAMEQVQEILSRIQPSIGPYFAVPADFEVKNWNEIMKALTSGTRSGMAWSLNVLALIVYDAQHEVTLQKLPGLLEALLHITNTNLMDYPVSAKYRTKVSNAAAANRQQQQQKQQKQQARGVMDKKTQGAGGGQQDQSQASNQHQQDKMDNGKNPWWWTLESCDVLSPDAEGLARSSHAVAACRILRNLSFVRNNAEYMAANPYCVGCLIRCLGEDLLFMHGTDGLLLRFASLDTLANMGASMSLPKLGVMGKGLMQQIFVLLGGPIMMPASEDEDDDDNDETKAESGEGSDDDDDDDDDDEDEKDEPELSHRIRGAILACDLLSQLSLGTENAHVIQQESMKLGAVAWLTSHLQNDKLQVAAVSALHRLVSLPGSTMAVAVAHQRWTLERLVQLLGTPLGGEAGAILKLISQHNEGRAALRLHETQLLDACLFGRGNARTHGIISKVLLSLKRQKTA